MKVTERSDHAYPSALAAWSGVTLLCVVYANSFIDRQIMSLLVEPIRSDLQISDTQLSLVHGFAFALFYAILGLPIGRCVDRGDRRIILALGVTAWSAFTVLCGLARSFVTLFLTRVGVGVGEATVAPSTYSLLADYFPPSQRGLPMGVFGAGVYAGIGLAFIVGGLVVQAVSTTTRLNLGPLGEFASWQLAFILVGAPGLLLALLVLKLAEPRNARSSSPAVHDVAARAWPHWRASSSAIVCHHISTALLAMALYALIGWAPEYFRRIHGLPVAHSGVIIGFVVGIAGTLGVVTAGAMGDALTRRGVQAARLIAMGIAAIAAAPTMALFAWSSTPLQAFACLGVSTFFLASLTNCGPVGVQELYPSRLRGIGSAVFQFVVTLVGLGLGPTVVAVVGDYVLRDEARLADAIALTTPWMAALAGVTALIGLKPYAAVIRRLTAIQSA